MYQQQFDTQSYQYNNQGQFNNPANFNQPNQFNSQNNFNSQNQSNNTFNDPNSFHMQNQFNNPNTFNSPNQFQQNTFNDQNTFGNQFNNPNSFNNQNNFNAQNQFHNPNQYQGQPFASQSQFPLTQGHDPYAPIGQQAQYNNNQFSQNQSQSHQSHSKPDGILGIVEEIGQFIEKPSLENLVHTVSGVTGGELSSEKIIAGMKEAMKVGIDTTIKLVGKIDGFFLNVAIKILIPPKLRDIADVLSKFFGKVTFASQHFRSFH